MPTVGNLNDTLVSYLATPTPKICRLLLFKAKKLVPSEDTWQIHKRPQTCLEVSKLKCQKSSKTLHD